jgi:hypothetical protein
MQLSDRSWSQVIGNLGAQLEQKTQALKDFQTKHKIRVRGRSDVRAQHLVCCPPVSVPLTLWRGVVFCAGAFSRRGKFRRRGGAGHPGIWWRTARDCA